MTHQEWPPPPTAESVWRPTHIGFGYERNVVRLREVRLWGQTVLIDESGNVWCDGCCEMIAVNQLSEPTNQHPVGLPFVAAGQLVPAPPAPPDAAGDEDEARPWPSW